MDVLKTVIGKLVTPGVLVEKEPVNWPLIGIAVATVFALWWIFHAKSFKIFWAGVGQCLVALLCALGSCSC